MGLSVKSAFFELFGGFPQSFEYMFFEVGGKTPPSSHAGLCHLNWQKTEVCASPKLGDIYWDPCDRINRISHGRHTPGIECKGYVIYRDKEDADREPRCSGPNSEYYKPIALLLYSQLRESVNNVNMAERHDLS